MELLLDRLAAGRSELAVDETLELGTTGALSDPAGDPAGPRGPARLEGVLEIDNMDQKVLVHGKLAVRREMDCHRCGQPTQQEYLASLEVLILCQRGRTRTRGRLGAVNEHDSWVIQANRGVVDLREAVREAVFLDEPLLVRCTGDCQAEAAPGREGAKALADDPGRSSDIDPRWEKLRRLRNADDDAE